MDIEKFIDIVERMRETQKEYFKTRNRNLLQRSIILEGLVDKEIKEYKEGGRKIIMQRDLFDDIEK